MTNNISDQHDNHVNTDPSNMKENMNDSKSPSSPTPKKKNNLFKRIILTILALIILFILTLGILASSDRGSRWLLELALDTQKMITYQYEEGNLIQGLSLKNVAVKLEKVDVNINQVTVRPGWRAIIHRELHLMTAKADTVQVINHAPSEDKPFEFSPIKLPFNLRLDNAKLNTLIIKHQDSVVKFYRIDLKNAIWLEDKIKVKHANLAMDYLNIHNITGSIQFNQKYPISAKAELEIPALKSLQINKIKILAKGDLDTVKAGIVTNIPDLISGYIVVHPVRKNVPMLGKIYLTKVNLPILTNEKLFIDYGVIDFNGNANHLNLNLNTDLKGQNIAKGNYQATMSTDYKKILINNLYAKVMQGDIGLTGLIDWQKDIYWDIQANIKHLKLDEKLLSKDIQQFLPKDLNANVSSKGHYGADNGSNILSTIQFDHQEHWDIHIKQQQPKHKKEIWQIIAKWSNINREIPYVTWLNSPSGQANIIIQANNAVNIDVNSQINSHEKSLLPQGDYQTHIYYFNQILNIKDFRFKQQASSLTANAIIQLPTAKKTLQWNGTVSMSQFNPQLIVPSLPVDKLDGTLQANGYANQDNTQQIIRLNNIKLNGKLPTNLKAEDVYLSGNSTIALLLNQTGLMSYAVNYDGHLLAKNYSEGILQFKISGTPEIVKISQFFHQGVAGHISADGLLNLVNGIEWKIKATVKAFKPQYFTSLVNGNIDGDINTTGQWSDTQKFISIDQLNLVGQLNHQPLLGRGQFFIDLNQKNTMKGMRANDLVVSYANNVVQATGNQNQLQLNINAPNLSLIYQGLTGIIKGYVVVKSQPQLFAQSNLVINNLGYNNLFNIEQAKLIGTFPTGNDPTRLLLQVNNIRSGQRQISEAKIDIMGTRDAHMANITGKNRLSQFSMQLFGGLTAKNDWYGQFRNGLFNSKRTQLKQNQNASMIYDYQKGQLSIMAHCWISQNNANNQLCLDKPLSVSKQQGAISISAKNIQLGDFQAFMPTDLSITGLINGYAHLSWLNGQPMDFEAQFLTQNGTISLDTTDENDADTTQVSQLNSLKYNKMRIFAKTLSQGLSIKVEGDTPLLGQAYLDALIGTQGADKSLTGSVVLNEVKLSILKPFINDVRILDGKLSAAGKLSGTLSAPLFDGEVRVKNGRVAMISVPVDLQNIQIQSSIRGSEANIVGAFNAGQGAGKITGKAVWSGIPRIQLNVLGQNLLMAQPPTISSIVSPNLSIEIQPTVRMVNVTGKVDIPRALIYMPETSETVVATSSDVRVVRRNEDQLALLRASRPWDIRANIAVELGKQVIFRGFNGNIPLVGGINLSQKGTAIALQANGAIGASRQVKIEAYGQSLDLNRAILRFNGALANPLLDIDATKKINNSTVGMRITGNANRPNIQIYNDAGLSEQEALNALITGSINSSNTSTTTNNTAFKSDITNSLAAAGVSLGLSGTRALTNQIGRSFGLSGLALDAQGTGSDTQVSVTGYITPDLYLRYGVGIFTAVNTLTLRYQINRRLYFEASASVERAVDIFYNWRF